MRFFAVIKLHLRSFHRVVLKKAMSVRYSYPQHFVHALKEQYQDFETLLQRGNEPSTLMVRIRDGQVPHGWTPIVDSPLCVGFFRLKPN